MYHGLGQSPPMLPHPVAVPGPMNPSYQPNSLPGYPTGTAPTGEQGYSSAMASQAAAYASNATSPRGTPPTIGFSPSVYPQSAAAAAYGYGAPTYHATSSYPYSAALTSASTVSASPYNPSSYSQNVPSSLSYQQAAAQQAGMIPSIQMIQGVPRTVYVTDTRPTIPSSAGLMSGAAMGTTSPHAAAAAAAAQAAYYQQPGWQQQQAAAVAQQQQAQQPHRTFNPNPYAPHW